MFITLKKMIKMSDKGIDSIRINGNTVITKKSYDYAMANNIDLIAVKDSIINEKCLDVMKDPGVKVARIIRKIRSKY